MSQMWGKYEGRETLCRGVNEGALMEQTNDSLKVYFMGKFREMGIKVVPPKKKKLVKRHQ